MNRDTLLRYTSLLLFPASAVVVLAAVHSPISPWIFVVGATGIFVSMLLLARLCRDRKSFWFAILLALLVRLLFVSYYPPSIDVNRYIWEGMIQHHGFNPFTEPPDSQAMAHLRDSNWQGVTFKDTPTIYWPFAQMLFRAATTFGPGYLAIKLIVTLFDVIAIGLLIHMARRRNHPLRYVLLYALNPLVLIFTSGLGHIESVVATLILAAVALSEGRYKNLAYTALSCAILTKIYAVALLPFFLRNIGIRGLIFLFLPLLLFIPYQADISIYFDTPTVFAGDFSYNGLLHSLLRLTFGLEHNTTLLILATFLMFALTIIFFSTPSLPRASSIALGLMLLCLPTVQPWYFLLLTPYLVFFRQWSWLSLHLTSLLLIFYFNPAITPKFFHNQSLLMTWEYLPFLILAAYDFFRGKKHWPAAYPAAGTVSVIIPVRNEEGRISACIDSLLAQNYPCEIIVVDGGSTDRTLQLVQKFQDIVTCHSDPGRGIQIAQGITHASGDLIVVLHADSRLKTGSLGRMIAALAKHSDAAGGAMAATYDSPSTRFKLIALLNNLRARFTGISFGDQAQFFRRVALPEGFPAYRLMEDVELSLRMKEHGSVLFLPDGVLSSSRRWASTGYSSNFFKVIWLTGSFLFLRAFNMIHDNGEWFYQRYYRKAK